MQHHTIPSYDLLGMAFAHQQELLDGERRRRARRRRRSARADARPAGRQRPRR